MPAELGGVVFIAKDLSLLKRLDELQHLNKMFQEVAVQTRPSLSLVFSWLRRLKEKSTDPGAAETMEKVLKQLRKVELTYDRLMLGGQEKRISSSEKMLLDPSEILERIRSELPEVELARIEWMVAPDVPLLRGDPFQLCFCLESILSYLMRFLPEEEKIHLRVDEEENQVVLRVEGFFPRRPSEAEGKETGADFLSRTRMDMALGENIIRAFVDNHDGRYHDPVQKGKKLAFRIDLPAEGKRSL
jgi:K+-sensing histidine kinase KdpD